MFQKLLIANRGEIAVRIVRTARRMGIATVAVFSDADATALHAAIADQAVPIGPAPARDSYLRIDRIIDAARRTGADAIHPGYGFLSENPAFAEACAAAGIAFIGPPPAAIRAMGSKSAAKSAMEQAGVPLVPGYHGTDQDPAHLAAEAARIGYPVLIKASAGGGGKGMRIVAAPADFAEALASAQGEAASAFGDDQVLVERYLTRPRHIEIQVFADTSGTTISLFERDCSIQRRHQKIVEEAPAPGMTPERRAAMGQAACDAARAIGYVGAGTVEFIAEGDAFYFMEMNTRLQVEHPVTEMITGLDLVEWQLRVAAGQPLPTTTPTLSGHAIEVRLYAEDPARDFMPAIGRLTRLRAPELGPHVRLDTGVQEGDTISLHYDPMIAKLIVWDTTRDAAIARLRQALDGYDAAGPQTNLPLLRRIAAHPAFAAAQLDTGFIARHEADLLPPRPAAPPEALAAAAAHAAGALDTTPAASPWDTRHAWRLNAQGAVPITLRDHDTTHHLVVEPTAQGTARIGDIEVTSTAILCDGVRTPLRIGAGDPITIHLAGAAYAIHLPNPFTPPATTTEAGDRIIAPMPGRIISVAATAGQHVVKGQIVLVLEAMKVQMRLQSPRPGTVATVNATPGTLVEEGTELITLTPAHDE